MLSSIRYISYKAKKSCRKGKQPYKYREHNDVQDKNQHLSSISLAGWRPQPAVLHEYIAEKLTTVVAKIK
jgi:hypothetical protein